MQKAARMHHRHLRSALALTLLSVPAVSLAQTVSLPPGQSLHTTTGGGVPIQLDDSGSGIVVSLPGSGDGPLWVAPSDDGAGFTVMIPEAYPAGGTVTLADSTTEAIVSLPSTDTFPLGGLVPMPNGSGLEVLFPNAGGLDLSGTSSSGGEVVVSLPGGAPPLDLSGQVGGELTIAFFAQPESGITVEMPADGGLVLSFPAESVVTVPTATGPLDLSGDGLIVQLPASAPFAVAHPLPGEMVVNFARGAVAASSWGGLYEVRGPVTITPMAPRELQPARADVSGDGVADLLWAPPAGQAGAVYATAMDGAAPSAHQIVTSLAGGQLTVVGTGDVDGDGRADLILQEDRCGTCGSSTIDVILLGPAGPTRHALPATIARVHTTGDFNGDGKVDLVTRDPWTGAVEIVELNGLATPRVEPYAFATPGGAAWSYYKVAGAGDFDGDGKADLLWQSRAYGAVAVSLTADHGWGYGSTTHVVSTSAIDPYDGQDLPLHGAWSVVLGTGDFDGDHRDDVLFRCTDLKVCVARMAGGSIPIIGRLATLTAATAVFGIGDYDLDGRADVAFHSGGFQSSGAYPQYCAPYELSNGGFCGSWSDGVGVIFGNGVQKGPVALATPGIPGQALPQVGMRSPLATW